MGSRDGARVLRAESGVTDRRILALVAAAAFAACASLPRSTAATPWVFPGGSWERARPAVSGYCQDELDDVRARATALPTTAMMAVLGGRVLFEYGDVTRVSYIASVRKSILAMLFGRYVESGEIALDRTLADLRIDDVGGLLPAEKMATVADLLSARSGVYHEASNAGDSLADAPPRGSQEHGTYFLYSNWDFNVLGTIFEQAIGRGIYDALEQDLVVPLGFQDFEKSTHRRTGDRTKSVHLAYHMNLSTRDMARVGYVMLREGQWNGRTVVPRGWIRRIVTPITRVHELNPSPHRSGPFGYGYLWWIWDGEWARGPYLGAYTAIGAFGQFITVLPARDMVVVHKTVPGKMVSRAEYLQLVEMLVAARCS